AKSAIVDQQRQQTGNQRQEQQRQRLPEINRDSQRWRAVQQDQEGHRHDDAQGGQPNERDALKSESAEHRGGAPQGCRGDGQQRGFAFDPRAWRRQPEVDDVRSAQRQRQADPETLSQPLAQEQPGQERGKDRLCLLQQRRRGRIANLDGLGEADRPQRRASPADSQQRSPLSTVEREPLGTRPPQRNRQRCRQDQVLHENDLGAGQGG